VLGLLFDPEDRATVFHQNVGEHTLNHMASHPRTPFEVTTLRISNLTKLNFFSAIRLSSSFASSEGDEDELDIDSDKEGEEGTTKIGKDGKELMSCEI
jgi:hypothetical protein